MSIGNDLLLGIARDIIASTPEAKIAAAESAKQISEAMADELRNALKVEEEAKRMAERIGTAMIEEIDEQRDAVLERLDVMVDAAEEKMSDAFADISGRFSEEDAREAVSDQERQVAEARAALEAGRGDPNADTADLTERLSDAERALRRSNYRLFEMLAKAGMSPMGAGAEQTEMRRIGAAAGLSQAEMLAFATAAVDIRNANSQRDAWQRALGTGEFASLEAAIASAIALGLSNVTFTIDGQVIDVRIDAGISALGARMAAGVRG